MSREGYGFEGRPMCDTPGCEMWSNFHGFGRDVCWGCYAKFMSSGAFYRLTQAERERMIIGNPTQASDRQLTLFGARPNTH